MKQNLKSKYSSIFKDFDNIRIYITLIIFSILVCIIGITSYYQIRDEVSKVGMYFRTSISKEISFSANDWIDSKVKFISFLKNKYTKIDNKDVALDYIKFIRENQIFDHFQIFLNSKEMIFDDKFITFTQNKIDEVKLRSWYKNTINSEKTKVSVFDSHGVLKDKTIHICSKFYRDTEISVFCGIINSKDFFQKIRPKIHSFVDNVYLFNQNGDVITSIDYVANPKELKKNFLNFIQKPNGNIFKHNTKHIEITKLQNDNLYIGVSIDEKQIVLKPLQILLKNGIILLIAFIFLIAISNSLHTFIYEKILKKQKDYEFILSHELKMSETGELISAISHQLKQPINSSMLILSNILNLKKTGEISDEELYNSINLCIKSNKMMNSTVENFRKFYKFDDEIKTFDLRATIINLNNILHTTFSRYNINVKINNFSINLRNNESFLQQVLLVLLQNSKDALKNKLKDKLIEIKAQIVGENVEIMVCDNGCGIKESKDIFLKYKKSTKKDGSGIGLYLSRLIARNKLNGDLTLFSKSNPTIFKLILKQNLDTI